MYTYRVTVEDLPKNGNEAAHHRVLQFDVTNHDDLFRIVEAVSSKGLMDRDRSAALAVGLKLFSEVILENRDNSLFAPLSEPIRDFIQRLKTIPPSEPQPSDRSRTVQPDTLERR